MWRGPWTGTGLVFLGLRPASNRLLARSYAEEVREARLPSPDPSNKEQRCIPRLRAENARDAGCRRPA